MTDPLLDHLRATAHDTAPEPGPALDTALVMAHGRRRRRTRCTVGAVAGVAAFATAVAVGAPLLDRGTVTTDPAASSSVAAPTASDSPATAEPTASETSQDPSPTVPASPPEPVDLGRDHIAVTGPGADGYLGAPGGVKVWLRSTGDADHIATRIEFPNGHVWDFDDLDELEDLSREFFFPSYQLPRYDGDPEGEDGPTYPEVTIGHLGKHVEPGARAVLITGPETAAELPLFQIPGSDRWFYAFYQGPGSAQPVGTDVGRDHVIIRWPDGTYEAASCAANGPDGSCEVEESESWMEDMARDLLG